MRIILYNAVVFSRIIKNRSTVDNEFKQTWNLSITCPKPFLVLL